MFDLTPRFRMRKKGWKRRKRQGQNGLRNNRQTDEHYG